MKRGTPDHPKTKRLARLLGVEQWGACGILECLWHFTARHAMQGDIGKWEDSDIADGVFWRDDPAKLINALVDAGFLDKHETYRLLVHDWHDHAEQAVSKTLSNRQEPFLTIPEVSRKCKKKSASVPDRAAMAMAMANGKEGSAEGNQADSDDNPILAVFTHYKKYHPRSHPKPSPESKEWKLIDGYLKSGRYTVEQLCQAIDGCHQSPHHCGKNDKNQKFQNLELIVRDSVHIEQFRNVVEPPQESNAAPAPYISDPSSLPEHKLCLPSSNTSKQD